MSTETDGPGQWVPDPREHPAHGPTLAQVTAAHDRERAMRPAADRWIESYRKGLLTLRELSTELGLLDEGIGQE